MTLKNIKDEADLIVQHIYHSLLDSKRPDTEFMLRHSRCLQDWVELYVEEEAGLTVEQRASHLKLVEGGKDAQSEAA